MTTYSGLSNSALIRYGRELLFASASQEVLAGSVRLELDTQEVLCDKVLYLQGEGEVKIDFQYFT